VNQLRKLGIEKTILSNNSLQDQVYIDNVGENCEGQILLSYFGESGNPQKFEDWKAEYESRYGEPVDSHAFNTTDLIWVMFEAMKTSGNDREAFVEAMHAIADYPGLTTNITMEENGNMTKPFSAFVIKDGAFTVWTKD
ncbi:MAG: ABC transporter substrate-binding protein, partial [Oscillospiraceae bacterium]|nr:ABC transporter substrate-binding protein [Oscillospiraceae bacterium]